MGRGSVSGRRSGFVVGGAGVGAGSGWGATRSRTITVSPGVTQSAKTSIPARATWIVTDAVAGTKRASAEEFNISPVT
jgi:hypothetical protein